MESNTIDKKWHCPLLKKEIQEGMCLDINYQRLDMFSRDVLDDIMKLTKKNIKEINETCEACPYCPFR